MGNIMDFLRANWMHVAPILAAGAFGIVIFLERFKAIVLTYPLWNSHKFFDKIRDQVMADRVAEAIAYCDKHRKTMVAVVVREGLLRAHQPESMIEDGLQLAISEAHLKVQRRTSYLSLIANVATLLGLLGTIVGPIQAFEAVGNAAPQQKAALLAAGISTSMNATMLGLVVAIPAMVAFSFLMNRTNQLNSQMEQAAVRTMDLIKQRYYAAETGRADLKVARTGTGG